MTPNNDLTLSITDEMRAAALALAQTYNRLLSASQESNPLGKIQLEQQTPPEISSQQSSIPLWTSKDLVFTNDAQIQLSEARGALKTATSKANQEALSQIASRTLRDRALDNALNQLVAREALAKGLSIPHQGRYYGPQLGRVVT